MQAHLLDLIESRDPLPVLLDTLARYVESLFGGIRCSILLADPCGVLLNGAAPSLSAEFMYAIDRLPIREGAGVCGTAAARREMIVLEDVTASPLVHDFLDLARANNIAACWSAPIIDARGELLGTFALYYSQVQAPSKEEVDLIHFAGALAAIVIRRHQEIERLAADESHYRQLAETSPDAVLAHRDGRIIYRNAATVRLLALDQQPAIQSRLQDFIPDDWPELHAHRSGMRATRLRRLDGSWIDLEIAATEISIQGASATLWVCRDVSRRVTLEQAILDAASREQERMGYELHDGLGQQLTGISLLLSALERQVTPVLPATAGAFHELTDLLTRSIEDTRRVAVGLSPVAVDRAGLAGALHSLAIVTDRFHRLRCQIKIDSSHSNLDPIVATHLYRIAQGAVQNVVRHASARNVLIELSSAQSILTLTVIDDGVGIPPQVNSEGLGLRSMQYRARRIGGTVRIERRIPRGTQVKVTCPLR